MARSRCLFFRPHRKKKERNKGQEAHQACLRTASDARLSEHTGQKVLHRKLRPEPCRAMKGLRDESTLPILEILRSAEIV